MFKSKQTFIWASVFSIIVLLSLTACNSYRQSIPPKEITGVWVGLAQSGLSSEFLSQREIPIYLEISQKGEAQGSIGDADFGLTPLQKPAFWLKIFGKKGYRIKFVLAGNIVNRESFKRDGGTLVIEGVNDDDELICHFTSTGTQVNSKNMVLTMKNIKLHHPL